MRSALKLIWTITATVTFLQAANGLWQALLPLRMQAEGISTVVIGYVATSYGLGFTIGCLFTPILIRRVGHIRAFASLAAISAIVAIFFTQASGTESWILLRCISGISMAGLFTVSDSWTSSCATSENRGRVLSIYMIFNKIALVISPLGIALGSVKSDGLFMAVSVLMSLSLLPICAANAQEPPSPTTVRINIRRIFTLAPSAAIGSFVVGLMNGPITNLVTVYGTSLGMTAAVAAALLFAIQGGSLIMQWPLGIISDKYDRRYVIAGLGGGTFLVCMLTIGATFIGSIPLVFLSVFLWGGIALCIYAVCVAHVCDVVPAEEIVPSVSGLLMLWAIGMAIGPAPAAYIMERFAPWALFFYSGCVSLLMALFVLWRIHYKKREPVQGGFVIMTPTTPATAPLNPRAEPIEDMETADTQTETSTTGS
ncbi:MFS transporter [Microvirga sp. W0021]|uniref:MFS transporter n=1 Tax=Hohaiivirga grylli TaxID=3133970 RepID=A0ABV0BFZ5_9HYPH